MDKYLNINVGDKEEIQHTITQEDVEKFVDLTGDDNKLHTDSNYASQTSFKKPVAHGMLGASFISTIIGTKIPGDGALWFSQSLEFLYPVRVGDKLKVIAEVIKKIDRTRTIELRTEIYNQNKKIVTSGFAKVKVLSQLKKRSQQNKASHKNVALVIGGSGGIGSASCIQLAKDGFDLAIHYFSNEAGAKELKNKILKIGSKCVLVNGSILDMDSIRNIKNTAERSIGKISVVINCATLPIPNIKFDDADWSDMQSHYDLNVKSSFNLLKVFSPEWEDAKFGKYIGITSLYTEQFKAQLLGYSTGKSALNGFIKALAYELGPKGIRLNLVSPGMVDTQLIADVPEKTVLLSASQTPLRTLADPKDIANVISFLSSEKSNYLTGETIRVNGGQSML